MPEARTQDLAAAAWLKMHGLRVLNAKRFGANGQGFEFTFADPENRAPQLLVDFANSEAQRYDSEVRSLKKLCNPTR